MAFSGGELDPNEGLFGWSDYFCRRKRHARADPLNQIPYPPAVVVNEDEIIIAPDGIIPSTDPNKFELSVPIEPHAPGNMPGFDVPPILSPPFNMDDLSSTKVP